MKYLIVTLLFFAGTASFAQTWKDVGSPVLSTAMTDYITEVTDSVGLPYIGYADWAYGARFTVQHFDGVKWNIVGDPGFSSNPAFYKEIALGPNGVPYVVFEDVSRDETVVMKFDGTSWVQVGPIVASNGNCPSIAIASDGTPYVTQQDAAPAPYVSIFKFDGTAWVRVGLPYYHPATTFEWPHIRIGKNDTPFVATVNINSPGGRIAVLKFNSTSWVSVDSAGFGPGNGLNKVALAIDSLGIPYVAFDDTDNAGKATIKKYIGGRWTPVGSIGFSAGRIGLIDLVISKKQQPYVCFRDSVNGDKVTAMTYVSGKWIIIGNPGFSNVDAWGCIGVDSIGVPYVFYSEGHAGRKAFVRRPGLSPITGDDTVCIGRDITQSHIVSGGIWASSNTAKATVSATGVVSGLDTGTVTITYSVPAIPAVIDTITIKDCRLNVPAIDSHRIMIFPNPVNDELNIVGIPDNTAYRISTITGMRLNQGVLHHRVNTVSIKDFTPGIYILEMINPDGRRNIVRVVKK